MKSSEPAKENAKSPENEIVSDEYRNRVKEAVGKIHRELSGAHYLAKEVLMAYAGHIQEIENDRSLSKGQKRRLKRELRGMLEEMRAEGL